MPRVPMRGLRLFSTHDPIAPPTSFRFRFLSMSLNDPQWGKRGSSGGPPDLDEIWRNVNRRINDLFGRRTSGPGEPEVPGGGPPRPRLPLSGVGILVALVIVVWLASGFYIVDEGSRGVVTRFG